MYRDHEMFSILAFPNCQSLQREPSTWCLHPFESHRVANTPEHQALFEFKHHPKATFFDLPNLYTEASAALKREILIPEFHVQ